MQFSPTRILLIKPSSMGDVIHALPVLSQLHEAWPTAEIRWLIQPAWEPLLGENKAVSQTILFPRERFRGVKGFVRSLFWAKTLRTWKPDLVIDLQGLLRSALMARCSGAKRIIGLSDAREGATLLYSKTISVNKKDHAVVRYLNILNALGIPLSIPEFSLPQGKLPAGFSVKEPFVVLHPFARGKGKNLTKREISIFAKTLNNIPIVLVGKGEIIKELPPNVIDWSGKTSLQELIAILRQAAFIVSSDSGPMHLATALQPTKILAIHRWSDPLRVGPWSKESFVWKKGKILKVDQLTEEMRDPGVMPTEEQMREIGIFVLEQIERKK